MVEQHFVENDIIGLNYNGIRMWRCMWITTIWGIWNHRNNVIFNGKVVDPIEICTVTQIKAWTWVNHKFPNTNFSYSDWCLILMACLKSFD